MNYQNEPVEAVVDPYSYMDPKHNQLNQPKQPNLSLYYLYTAYSGRVEAIRSDQLSPQGKAYLLAFRRATLITAETLTEAVRLGERYIYEE